MEAARSPWWVIGSAAVMLHGGATAVADVDVLLSIEDAEIIAPLIGLVAVPGREDALFQSARFFAWIEPPLTVEFMAKFSVSRGGAWLLIEPQTRERIAIGPAKVFVPSLSDLRGMLTLFGRPKDVARLTLLPE